MLREEEVKADLAERAGEGSSLRIRLSDMANNWEVTGKITGAKRWEKENKKIAPARRKEPRGSRAEGEDASTPYTGPDGKRICRQRRRARRLRRR